MLLCIQHGPAECAEQSNNLEHPRLLLTKLALACVLRDGILPREIKFEHFKLDGGQDIIEGVCAIIDVHLMDID